VAFDANTVRSPRSVGKTRRPSKSRLFGIPYGAAEIERREWNDKVDAAKRDKWQKKLDAQSGKHVKLAWRADDQNLPVNRTGGATFIRDLIWNYQVNSRNITKGMTGQRRAEFERRKVGRSEPALKAEAEFMHKAKKHSTKRVSARIGGRTLRVIERLIRLQDVHFENKRTADWAQWEAVGNGIWQYGESPYFMFNDEAGELFQYDPAKLHFPTIEDCNEAIRLYAICISRDKPANADQVFKDFCEKHGRSLVDSDDDAAGDENYALES